jgi:hypothetical protein
MKVKQKNIIPVSSAKFELIQLTIFEFKLISLFNIMFHFQFLIKLTQKLNESIEKISKLESPKEIC